MTVRELPPKGWDAALPCPFCNGVAQLLSCESRSRPGYGSNACVCCSKCGAGGPSIEPLDWRLLVDIERQAIALWNRRGMHTSATWKLERIAQILRSTHAVGVE